MGGRSESAVRGRHLPALDGLRALAVGGVIAYHLRLGWAAGGYLGVDLFFVLSGFLITGLLLEERVETGRIALGAFWGRRARRLLPALLLLLGALALAATVGALPKAIDIGALRGDALATIAYVANWHQLVVGQSYFAQFQAPSPLQHTWSLAIEEQFYLLWPPFLAAAVWALSRRGRRAGRVSPPAAPGGPLCWRRPLLITTLIAAGASAAWMGWLAARGAGLDRMYYGTDTRAFDLLAGAALAMAVAARPAPGRAARRALHAAGVAAAGGLATLWALAGSAGQPPRLMFEGGFVLAAAAAVVVLADARLDEAGALGRLLRLAPFRFVGRISYGVYLWHWPVITEVTAARVGLRGAALDVLQVGLILALSTASYYLVEQRMRRARLAKWPRLARTALAPSAMGVTALVVALATVPPAAAQASAGSFTDGGAVAGAGGVNGQVPLALPGGRVPSHRAPLRVVLLGDSVMMTQASAIEAALEATGAAVVTDRAFPGWGLSTDPTWAQELKRMEVYYRPDLVVATWGWDNAWALSDPSSYRRVLQRFVRVVLHPGDGVTGAAGVLFEQYPPTQPLTLTPGQGSQIWRQTATDAWNRAVSTLPAAFPGKVQYLPLGPAVELGGRFSFWLPPAGDPSAPQADWVRVRRTDGVHFCPSGAARYADALLADLQQLVSLPAVTTRWWTGRWATDPSQWDPGTCPADHPPPGTPAGT